MHLLSSPQTHPFKDSPAAKGWRADSQDKPVAEDDTAAFFFPASDGKQGFIDAFWCVGEVLEMKKGKGSAHWADILFPDGKLWMSIKGEDRGNTWFTLERTEGEGDEEWDGDVSRLASPSY